MDTREFFERAHHDLRPGGLKAVWANLTGFVLVVCKAAFLLGVQLSLLLLAVLQLQATIGGH